MLELNVAILFLSIIPLFARLIHLPAHVIIFGRAVISGITLLAFMSLFKIPLKLGNRKAYLKIFITGALLCVHWVTYFLSVQLAGVAIASLTLFTFPIIVTILEPIITKSSFRRLDLLLAVIVFAGIYMLVPDFDFKNEMTIGTVVGLSSAVFYAFRNILSKKYFSNTSGVTVMFYQLCVTSAILLPFSNIVSYDVSNADIGYLLLVSIVFSGIGHTLIIRGLQNFKATKVAIISCWQPVSSIILAALFLGESPTIKIIIGGIIIISMVMVEILFPAKNRTINEQTET